MASVIQYDGSDDPRARKTFSQGETGWHTEMNANMSETVEQCNDNEADIATNTAAIATNVTNIGTNTSDLATHEADVANPHSVTAAQAGALALAGGTMTGDIVLDGDPTNDLHPATKQYVDNGRVYDFAVSKSAVPTSDEIIMFTVVGRPLVISSGTPGYAKSNTAATGETTFTILKNSVSVGTIVFSASGTTGAFTVGSDITLAADDVLEIQAPNSADATIAGIMITLLGTLS